MSLLILVRHGESEWNASKRITGQADVGLTEEGKRQAQQVGQKLRAINIDVAYTSQLRRAVETLSEIQGQLQTPVAHKKHKVLNERNFGALTGRIKSEVIDEIGADSYATILQSWDITAPEGESLKAVYERVVPYLENELIEALRQHKNVLIVSHHHTLRTLVKRLEALSNDEVVRLKLNNADAIIYDFNPEKNVFVKQTT